MVCVSSLVVNHLASGFYLFLIFICWVSGRSKHNVLVHANNFAVALLLNLICLWYFAASYGGFCWMEWERDDGVYTIPFYQFAISATINTLFTLIVSLRPQSGAMVILIHFAWCLVYNLMFLWGSMAFTHAQRVFWIAGAMVLALFSFYHAVKDSKVAYPDKPRMVKYLLVVLALYQFIYFSAFLWSPFQQGLIGFFAFELVLFLAASISTTIVCILVLQYGKALFHKPQTSLLKPGDISKLIVAGTNADRLRKAYHTHF